MYNFKIENKNTKIRYKIRKINELLRYTFILIFECVTSKQYKLIAHLQINQFKKIVLFI